MFQLPIIVSSVVDSYYLDLHEIIAWADKLIMKAEKPQMWLIDISLSKNKYGVISFAQSVFIHYENIEYDLINLEIGFWYLRYLEGKISLEEFVTLAGSAMDGSYFKGKTIEDMAVLYERWRKGEDIEGEVHSFFNSYAETSRQCYDYMMRDGLHEREIEIIEIR